MKTVLVTGASGFIAKHVIRELLEQGYRVKASVRSDKGRGEVEALFPDAGLEFVTLDLTSDEGWGPAMAGVDVLMHTASPFPMSDPKDPAELIGPAVDGTLRALRAAQAAGVTRVVLTSSCAAIYKSKTKAPEARSTRNDWTDPEGPSTSTYEASKTLAELAAWDFVSTHPEMNLTVVNPAAVLGPPLDDHYVTSLGYVEQVISGKVPMFPRVMVPLVDVRDVARVHVGVIDRPESHGLRFPAIVGAPYMAEMGTIAKRIFPDRKLSDKVAPNWLVKLMARFNPTMRTTAKLLGLNTDVDGSDATTLLGFEYISVEDAFKASAKYLATHGK